jgi:hypothetical protein
VFLQDADALAYPHRKLLAVLEGVRRRFPTVERVTIYGRARTVSRRTIEQLAAYREAGLSRVHMGLESGSDAVLARLTKGVTAEQHVEAGRRGLAAGLHLSCYVMPGLGGSALSEEHVRGTAGVLRAIEPSMVRLRSLGVAPGTPLDRMVREGAFQPLGEVDTVREIRALLARMGSMRTKLSSDHDLNLLPELEGQLPAGLPGLLDACDRFLALSPLDQRRFVLGRRLRRLRRVSDLDRGHLRATLDADAARLGVDLSQPVDDVARELLGRMI